MLSKINAKEVFVSLENSLAGLETISATLHNKTLATAGVTYSHEDASVALGKMFSGFKNIFSNLNIFKNFKASGAAPMENLVKKLSLKEFSQLTDIPFTVQDGLQVNLLTWIRTLNDGYYSIRALESNLDGIISVFSYGINNPLGLDNLSRFGVEKLTDNTEIENKFHDMFKGVSSKATIGTMIDNKSDLRVLSEEYRKLYSNYSAIDLNRIEAKVKKIISLADKFTEHQNKVSQNRALTQDLSSHIATVANHVTFMSLLDNSYKILEKSLQETVQRV